MKLKIFFIIFFVIIIIGGFIYYSFNFTYKSANLDDPMSGIYAKFYQDGISDSHIVILYDDYSYLSIIKSTFETYTEKGKWKREDFYIKLNPNYENLTTIEFEIVDNNLKILNKDSDKEIILQRLTEDY